MRVLLFCFCLESDVDLGCVFAVGFGVEQYAGFIFDAVAFDVHPGFN